VSPHLFFKNRNEMLSKHFLIALLTTLLTSSTFADLVITNDGARLTGTITLIDQGIIHLKTPYAGTLKIKQEQVASFETETAVVVRLQSGTVMAGPVESSSKGTLKIRSEDGVLETNTAKVVASWAPRGGSRCRPKPS